MIVPQQKDAALLRDILATEVGPHEFALWWIGQSGFLLKSHRHYAIIDPYLSDSLTRKYAATHKPHVRMTERCIDPTQLGFVTLALSTHGHTDHFDPETLQAIATAPNRREPLTLVLPQANVARAATVLGGLDVKFVPMNSGSHALAADLEIRAVPAAHPVFEQDGLGHDLYLGYVITIGRRTLYHSGDTLWHDAVTTAVAATKPDIALLPINGNEPERGVAGNLNGAEAARFARALGVKVAIPHHFEMFEFNTASTAEFVRESRQLGVTSAILRCGQRWDSAGLNA